MINQNKTVQEIKSMYPNIPTNVLLDIVKSYPNIDADTMYKKIRYADVPYPVNKNQFTDAVRYAYHDSDHIRHSSLVSVFDMRELNNLRKLRPDAYNYGFTQMVKYHVAFNVNMDKKLIQDMDNLLIQDAGKNICYYKYLKFFEDYQLRHDPMVMYLFDTNPKLEQNLINIAGKNARSSDGLIGRMLSDGIALSTETSNQEKYHYNSVGQIAVERIQEILSKQR